MPAYAGIQVRCQFKFKNGLDSGFRRNDRRKIRAEKAEPVGFRGRVI
jgi:hypothetical protein